MGCYVLSFEEIDETQVAIVTAGRDKSAAQSRALPS